MVGELLFIKQGLDDFGGLGPWRGEGLGWGGGEFLGFLILFSSVF